MLFQRAFAKINLGLRILRKRPDGFHDLETVFHRIALHDGLAVEEADDLVFECDDPSLSGEDNLVVTAAKLLQGRFGVRRGARIALRKRIPHGAGLGGGSSDAATALTLLSRLWGLRPGEGELAELGLAAGSDVPFFLGTSSARGLSRGERLEWFPLVLPWAILVVTPPVRISTREAFGRVTPGARVGAGDLGEIVRRGTTDLSLLREALHNDFEGPVFSAHPEVAAVRDRLYASGAGLALMSGSGSSVFGLFAAVEEANRAMAELPPGCLAWLTPPRFVPDLGTAAAPF